MDLNKHYASKKLLLHVSIPISVETLEQTKSLRFFLGTTNKRYCQIIKMTEEVKRLFLIPISNE